MASAVGGHPGDAPSEARRRGPRGDLGVADLTLAVRMIADEQGVDALSLRAVARRAGVAPNATYSYLHSWDDLLQQASDEFLGEIDLAPLAAPGCARCRLVATVRQAEQLFARHPAMAQLAARGRVIGHHSLTLNEALLRFFDQHLPGRSQLAVDLVTTWLLGSALLAPGEQPTAEVARRLQLVDWGEFPLTAASRASSPEEPVEVILDGLGLRHTHDLA